MTQYGDIVNNCYKNDPVLLRKCVYVQNNLLNVNFCKACSYFSRILFLLALVNVTPSEIIIASAPKWLWLPLQSFMTWLWLGCEEMWTPLLCEKKADMRSFCGLITDKLHVCVFCYSNSLFVIVTKQSFFDMYSCGLVTMLWFSWLVMIMCKNRFCLLYYSQISMKTTSLEFGYNFCLCLERMKLYWWLTIFCILLLNSDENNAIS